MLQIILIVALILLLLCVVSLTKDKEMLEKENEQLKALLQNTEYKDIFDH